MSLYLPSQSVIQPMKANFKPAAKQTLQNPIFPTSGDTYTAAIEANKKLNKGLLLMTGSGLLSSAALLIQIIAEKAAPQLEKSCAIQLGAGLTGIAGMLYAGMKMVVPAAKQLEAIEKSTYSRNVAINR